MGQQSTFELSFLKRMGKGQEVEVAGIPENLNRHLRLLWRQRLAEVRQELPFPGIEPAFDHVAESISVPTFADRSEEVPVAGARVLYPVEQEPKMTPG